MLVTPPDNGPETGTSPQRLDSWKEIATYLKRDVTTVRRWEKRERLPVHRHVHDKLGSVYAFATEIDDWVRGRAGLPADGNHDGHHDVQGDEPVAPDQRANGVRRAGTSRSAWLALGSLICVAVLIGGWRSLAGREAAARPVAFLLDPPDGASIQSVALSPDGRAAVFTGSSGAGPAMLWIRPLDAVTPQPMPGTEGASFPFWSPDSRFVAFFANRKLRTIEVSTRVIHDVCDAPDGRGGTWNRSGVILFSPAREQPIFRVSAAGGRAAPVTQLEKTQWRGHVWPEFLPDGRHFLYLDDRFETKLAGRHGVYVGDLDTGVVKQVLRDYSNAIYTRDGHLLFVREGALVVQRFDLRRLQTLDEPIVVASHLLEPYGVDHRGEFAYSAAGMLTYRDAPDARKRLVWVDRRGQEQETIGPPAAYSGPVLSPDGTMSAVTIFDPDERIAAADVYVLDLASRASARFTFGAGFDFFPIWSPTGDQLAFASQSNGRIDIHRRRMATADQELAFESPLTETPQAWSPDGRFIVYSAVDRQTRSDIWVWPVDGSTEPFPIVRSEHDEGQSQISPDGRYMAYASDESGRFEVYVTTFPEGTGKWQVSIDGGADPRWRPDGGELMYIAADCTLMAVEVRAGAGFVSGASTPLFTTEIDDLWEDTRNHYDVAAGGGRFLFVKPVVSPRTAPFVVALNWQAPKGS